MPKLSVLVLAYNVGPYIAQTLDSVLSQDVEFDYDIHVGNDGSTDDTASILREYAARHPNRIKLHLTSRSKRTGTGDYVNFSNMFRDIVSEYFCVLDGDDYWVDRSKLKKQIEFLDQNPDFTVCGHNNYLLQPDSKLEKANSDYWADADREHVAESFREIMLDGKVPYMQTSSLMYRNVFAHDAKTKRKFTRAMYSGDLIRTLVHAERGKVKYFPDVMSVYRILNSGDWGSRTECQKDMRHIDFYYHHRRHTFDQKYRILFDEMLWRYCLKFMDHYRSNENSVSLLQLMKVRWIYMLLKIKEVPKVLRNKYRDFRGVKQWLKDFYFDHFDRYPVMRLLKHSVQLVLWKIRVIVLVRVKAAVSVIMGCLYWRHFYTLKNLPYKGDVLKENRPLNSPACRILNNACIPFDLRKPVKLQIEPVTHRIFEDATVFGLTDTLINKDEIIYLQSADLSRHISAEQCKNFFRLDFTRRRAMLLEEKTASEIAVDEAVSLIGGTSVNYVHWLTEYLPKLFMLEDNNYTPIPVLVDEGLPETLKESLKLLARYGHEIIYVKAFQPCRVRKLHIIDTGVFVPFGFRNPKSPDIRDGDAKFSSIAIEKLRERCAERIEGAVVAEPSRKYFVLRKSNYRAVSNQNEVEKIALNHGYITVMPEQYSFAEQVRLFASATHIIGQTGAGIGNFLFSPPGCSIILFAANLALGNYRYFHNMASLCGHDLSFIEGRPDDAKQLHSDFSVDLNCLTHALEQPELPGFKECA